MFIVAGSGHGDTNSNPGLLNPETKFVCKYFTDVLLHFCL